jgi:hypothetical protein
MENSAPRFKTAVVSAVVGALCIGLTLFGTGCPQPVPPPAAILAGDWGTTTAEDIDVVLTFNSDGVVVTITGTAQDGTVARLTVTGATTTLEGSAVTVVVPTGSRQVTFEGTLSDDQNTMTGSLTQEIVIDDVLEIIIPQGDVTLTRIVEPECTTDDDCETDEICVDGACVVPSTGCLSDADCEDGQFCDTDTGECVDNENLYDVTRVDADYDPRVHFEPSGHAVCTVCHHAADEAAGIPNAAGQACVPCHSDDPNVPGSFKEVAHDQNESGDGCRMCHAADFSNCAYCHPLVGE